MVARRYEELVTWQLARELERRVRAFIATAPANLDRDYCDQIRRSSRSAPRNIAEGFGRYYPGEFMKFVRIAIGSLNETADHIDAGLEMRYLPGDLHAELRLLTNRTTGACVNLAKYLSKCKRPPRASTRQREG